MNKIKLMDFVKKEKQNYILEYENNSPFISIRSLQKNPEKIDSISSKQGYYKWWASKSGIEKILKKMNIKGISFEEIRDHLEYNDKEKVFCVYVGKSGNLHNRIKTHLIPILYRSTLRNTIGCLEKKVRNAEKVINNSIEEYIKDYKITCCPTDKTFLKKVGCKSLGSLEKFLIRRKLHILNIDGNTYDGCEEKGAFVEFKETKKIVTRLKELREC